jgi:cell division initiation protein
MEKITPVDIQHKSFKKALQGYDRAEVDAFLDEIIETLEDDAQRAAALDAEVADLKERISHFKAMEESLQNTLVLAQRTADETKASAHKEADLIREKARLEAEREIANYNDAIAEVRREHQRTVEANEKARSELRSLLMTHLSLVEKVAPPALSRDAVPAEAPAAKAAPAQPPAGNVNGGHLDVTNKPAGHLDVTPKPASKKKEPPSDDTTRITVY